MIRRRTSRLPPDTQAVLSVAAVIGRGFDLDVLGAVVELPLAEAAHRLEPALDDQDSSSSMTARSGRFVFSHALVSATLTDEQNAVRLARRPRPHHRRARDGSGRRTSSRGSTDLAHHASAGLLAGTAPKALDYARRAATNGDAAQSSDRRRPPPAEGDRRARPRSPTPVGTSARPAASARDRARDSGRPRRPRDPRGSGRLADVRRRPPRPRQRSSVTSTSKASGPATTGACTIPRVVAIVDRTLAQPDSSPIGSSRTQLTMALASELVVRRQRRRSNRAVRRGS